MVNHYPKDWRIVLLSELSIEGFQNGLFYEVARKNKGIPIINVGDLYKSSPIANDKLELFNATAEEIKRYQVFNGDLFFTRSSIVPSGIAFCNWYRCSEKKAVVFDSHVVRFKTNTDVVNPMYLYLACIRPDARKYFLANAKTATMTTIDQTVLGRCPIPYPALKEQTAIAEAVSDADNLIFYLQKLIEKKKAIKQGSIQELLTGQKRLPGFSVEWSEAPFANLFDFLPTNAFTRDQMTDNGTIQNVHYGDILTKYGACLDMAKTDVPYLLESVSVRKYSESSYVREGDVIIADTAEDSTTGKCVELVNVHGKVLSGQHTMLCRPKITFAPKFLGYYMNAECFHNQMLPFITGIKVSSISKANISTLVLKYPTLVEEQQAIAQVFSDMDDEIAQLEKKLAKYQQIKQGMMQELLTGRIRLVDADGKEQSKTQILQERQPAHNQHFDDAVMIAGIVNAFYSEKYPLGRKKVQKLLYLVRRKEQADISVFHKKAAGPYADEVRYKGGEPIAQKNKYIQVKRNEKGSRFEKGVQMQQALTYLQDWGKQGDVDWLVSQFQYTSVNELELLATVDMAICDLRREGKEISVASIKDLIRSNKEWRDKLKKTYFRDSDIQRAIKKCEDLFES